MATFFDWVGGGFAGRMVSKETLVHSISWKKQWLVDIIRSKECCVSI
jgi:hypothetical protein